MLTLAFVLMLSPALAQQNVEPPPLQLVQPQGQAAPPPVITLQDALDRAKALDAQYQLAVTNASLAREDRKQAKAALLP